MRRWVVAVALACACATTSSPPQPPLFEFHDNFWLNLHLFSRLVARGEEAPGTLSPDERASWDAAIRYYAATFAKRDLLFDDSMVAIKNELRKCDAADNLECASLDPELKATLLRVAPVYRRYWWPQHRASNERFIAEAKSLVRTYGSEISRNVAAAYGEHWPEHAVPIDVAVTAGPNAAYTTDHPTHTTIASTEPTYAGFAKLEMLFHEPSHAWGSALFNGIYRRARDQKKNLPPQLWHAVLFHTAGELTRRTLRDRGIDYVEYAKQHDIYSQLCGAGCLDRIAAAWDPHLDGQRSIDEALDALVTSWPSELPASGERHVLR